MSEHSRGLDASSLTELAGVLQSTSSFEELMRHLAQLAARAVPAAATCGITLSQDGHVVTVAAAGPLALLLDEQQYQLDAGPCLEALDTGLIVQTDDLSRETRWDGYPTRALAHGVSSIYSSPLLVADRPVGALNMYAVAPYAFDDAAKVTIAQLTSLAAATMTAAMRHYDEATLSDHLRQALSSRSVIDQAMGIVMANQHNTAGEAFGMLRGISQNRNVPVRDVAAELVAKTSRGPAA